MSQEKTTLEIIAPTVDEAVQKGLSQLNLAADAVDVEVLDSGSRGIFGLGSRQARVRLSIKSVSAETSAPAAPVKAVEAAAAAQPVVETVRQPVLADDEAAELAAEESKVALEVAEQVVTELLDKMRVKAKVTAVYRDPEPDEEEPVMMVGVEGNDLSILIGRHSETLNALQYIASLIICKRLNHWTPITLDIQGYRARRERQLRQLARRMAEQAVHSGRRQVLEPMPANERRLIHLELRDHPQVATESTGDEPYRKVTIFLK